MLHRGSLLVALVAFGVYAFLCPPVPGTGDASEFVLVLATNGVAHPTGYPLYTLLGHLFCLALHGLHAPWALAASLWSAVGGAVTIYFLHALGMELTEEEVAPGAWARFLAALVPVLLFAFQPILLAEATNAEVNAWNVAWTCAATYAFLRLLAEIAAGDAPPGRPTLRGAALWGLICGAGIAHHLTSVLVSGPLSAGLLVALALRRRLSRVSILAAAGSALLMVASYGIIAWRAWHPARVQWPSLVPDLTSLIHHVTGEQYRHFLGYFAPAPDQRALLARFGYPFVFPGLALLLWSAVRARGRERRIGWWALLAAAALVTGFTFRYGVPDPAPYFLPAMALGAAAVGPAVATIAGPRLLRQSLTIGILCLAGLALSVPWIRAGIRTRRDILEFESMVRSMWAAVPADTAIVLWPDDRFIRLQEYQILHGEKPALLVLTPDMFVEDHTREQILTRFGADPLAGMTIPTLVPGSADEETLRRRFLDQVVQNVNRRVRNPVIMFDPTVPVVRRLRKPWEPPDRRAARALPPGHPPLAPGPGTAVSTTRP